MSRVTGLFAIVCSVCVGCLIGCVDKAVETSETSLAPSSGGTPESPTDVVYADAGASIDAADGDACKPETVIGAPDPRYIDWSCPPIILWPPVPYTVKDLPYPQPFREDNNNQ